MSRPVALLQSAGEGNHSLLAVRANVTGGSSGAAIMLLDASQTGAAPSVLLPPVEAQLWSAHPAFSPAVLAGGADFGHVFVGTDSQLVVADPSANAGSGVVYVYRTTPAAVGGGAPVASLSCWIAAPYSGAQVGASLAMLGGRIAVTLRAPSYSMPADANITSPVVDSKNASLSLVWIAAVYGVVEPGEHMNGTAPPCALLDAFHLDGASADVSVLTPPQHIARPYPAAALGTFDTALAQLTSRLSTLALPADPQAPILATASDVLLVRSATVYQASSVSVALSTAAQSIADTRRLQLLKGARASTPVSSEVLSVITYCPPNFIQLRSSTPDAVRTHVCVRCPLGEASWGGLDTMCHPCDSAGVTCAASTDNKFARMLTRHAWDVEDVIVTAQRSGFNFTNGATYELTVRGVTASARMRDVNTMGTRFLVDYTPPIAGIVIDTAVSVSEDGNASCAECGANINYASQTAALALSWQGFDDPQSGILDYFVGVSTAPCDGIFHRSCGLADIVVTGEPGGTSIRSPRAPPTCSDAVLDHRAALMAARGGNGSAAQPLRFDFSVDMDVLPLRSVGRVLSFAVANASGLALVNGGTYYGCVIAKAGNRMTVAASSDGWTVDVTPPLVRLPANATYGVDDGFFAGGDITTQSYVDML
ncbi:hypothetical protein EON66_06810, partial [archaeon]